MHNQAAETASFCFFTNRKPDANFLAVVGEQKIHK